MLQMKIFFIRLFKASAICDWIYAMFSTVAAYLALWHQFSLEDRSYNSVGPPLMRSEQLLSLRVSMSLSLWDSSECEQGKRSRLAFEECIFTQRDLGVCREGWMVEENTFPPIRPVRGLGRTLMRPLASVFFGSKIIFKRNLKSLHLWLRISNRIVEWHANEWESR